MIRIQEIAPASLSNRISAGILAFLILMPLVANGLSVSEIPGGRFRLPDEVELAIVVAAFLIAIACYHFLWGFPMAKGVVATLVLLPVVEEILFRFVGIHLLAIGLLGLPDFKAFVYVGILFGFMHAASIWLGRGDLPQICVAPPGFQVGEGLFIGMFNGLIFTNFMYYAGVGLLVTMLYVWFAHIIINVVAVGYNLFVNIVLGGNLLAHLLPRLSLAICAAFWFYMCWTSQTVMLGPFV